MTAIALMICRFPVATDQSYHAAPVEDAARRHYRFVINAIDP